MIFVGPHKILDFQSSFDLVFGSIPLMIRLSPWNNKDFFMEEMKYLTEQVLLQ